ncbi:MAG TPA: hypothetical protein VGJ60_36715 [Chloroflexota bacterium]
MDPLTSEPVAPGVQPQPATAQPTWNDSFNQLDGYAEQLRLKLPLAPPGLMNAYMNVVPWVAIIFGVLTALVSLALLTVSTALSPFIALFGHPATGFGLILTFLLSLVISGLEIAGGIMMLKRRATGWWLLALGMIVSLVTSLLSVSVLPLIFWLLVAYVHLEVKPNYTN